MINKHMATFINSADYSETKTGKTAVVVAKPVFTYIYLELAISLVPKNLRKSRSGINKLSNIFSIYLGYRMTTHANNMLQGSHLRA